MSPYDDDEQLPELKSASVEKRVAAGAIDLFVLLVLIGLYFGAGLKLFGIGVPIWGVFAAIVGYSVVPLALFRSTVGMRLCGIELVNRRGRNAPVTDLLFRELIGRGFFPIAYLTTLIFGFVFRYLGIMNFAMPKGVGYMMFHLSWMLLAGSVLGQFLVVTRPDRRSLADLLARTVVVPKMPPAPEPTDAEERADARREQGRRLRTLLIAEVAMVMMGIGVPWLMTRRTSGGSGAYAERLKRDKLAAQFDAQPFDQRLASDLSRAHLANGDEEKSAEVWKRYDAARAEGNKKREASIRESVAKDPKSQQAQNRLLKLLLEQDRTDDAKDAFGAWVEADGDPALRASFGIWLYRHGYNADSVAELTTSFDAGFNDDGESYAYRAYAHRELNQLQEARADFERAMELEPELELEDELAALPPAPGAKKTGKKVARELP